MKPGRHKWIIVFAIAVVAVSALWLWQRRKEPRYQGKTIRQWIEVTRPNKSFHTNSLTRTISISITTDTPKELHRVLNAMGSNAVPGLVDILDDGDSTTTKLKSAIARSQWLPEHIKSAASKGLFESYETLQTASHAIRYLGPRAAHAIPDLERITCDPEKPMASHAAANALGGFGFQGLPVLYRSLTNAPSTRRQMIHVAIQHMYLEALQRGDLRDREAAALGLCEHSRPPFEVIWVLLPMLESPDPQRQKQSLHALAAQLPTLAPSLVAAREAIAKAAANEDPEIRRLATDTLATLVRLDSQPKP